MTLNFPVTAQAKIANLYNVSVRYIIAIDSLPNCTSSLQKLKCSPASYVYLMGQKIPATLPGSLIIFSLLHKCEFQKERLLVYKALELV